MRTGFDHPTRSLGERQASRRGLPCLFRGGMLGLFRGGLRAALLGVLVFILASPALTPTAFGAPDEEAGGNGFPAPAPAPVPEDEPLAAPAATATPGSILELSLAQAVEMGMRANLTVKASSYDTPMAYEGMRAANAAFDRLLTAGFDVARNETPSTFSFTGSTNVEEDAVGGRFGVSRRLRGGGSVAVLYRADRIDSNSIVAAVDPALSNGLTLEVIQPLLRGAGRVATADIRRAQNGMTAARATHAATVETILFAIVGAYWELVFADDNVAARLSSRGVARELLADAEARQASGVGSALDVAEANGGVERRTAELLAAENQRGSVQDQLLALIQPFGASNVSGVRVVPTDSSRVASQTAPDPANMDRYLSLALQGRPELCASRAGISNRSLDMIVAFDGIRPQLDITGRLVSSGLDDVFTDSVSDVLSGRAVTASVGVQFSMFVGQRAARAGWRSAGWARRQAVLRHREQENQIVLEVRAALRNLSTAIAQVSSAEREVVATTEGWEGEQDKLRQGKSTPFRVLQKEDDLTSARTRLGRAAADARIAESALWKAVGLLTKNLQADPPTWAECCR